MEWLINHYQEAAGGIVFSYDYDGEYEGVRLNAPWHSAFGQAYSILALIQWWKYTNDETYRTLLGKAVKGLVLPAKQGGCLVEINEGIWFEEIIGENMTHIFNAHLVSLIALIKAREVLAEEWISGYIENGLNTFYRLAPKMNTGVGSAYDIRSAYDLGIQLIPCELGAEIAIKSITVESGDMKRTLDIGGMEAFEVREEWIAGIDWGTADEEGFRRILNGNDRHPENLNEVGQHTYTYFNRVKNSGNCFKIVVEYKAERATELRVNRNCGVCGFLPMGYVDRILLAKGKNKAIAIIPCVAIAPHISQVYHRFHLQLLEELNLLVQNFKASYLLDKFRKYDESYASVPHVEAELKGIAVSVNDQCGLFCKMCDLGIKNRESSMFYHMKHENQKLDPDLLIRRCKEYGSKLEVVQIVGTEPTLYPELPYLVKELRQCGIKVMVTTNGINLRNQLVPLIEAGLSELDISIDGPEEVHDEIRGKKGLFAEIMEILCREKGRIREAKKHGFSLNIGVAVTPMNYLYLEGLLEQIKDSEIETVWCTHMNYITAEVAAAHSKLHPYFSIGASCTDKMMDPLKVNPWKMEKSMRSARNKAKKTGKNFICVPQLENYLDYKNFYHFPQYSVGAARCSAPYRTMQVNSDGSVCVMSRCYQFEIDNIKNKSLEELFYSQPMAELRSCVREALWDPCKRCCAIM
nr:D-glucuronyl C5-epimerase family protein [Anaerovorax sp. IOR16]